MRRKENEQSRFFSLHHFQIIDCNTNQVRTSKHWHPWCFWKSKFKSHFSPFALLFYHYEVSIMCEALFQVLWGRYFSGPNFVGLVHWWRNSKAAWTPLLPQHSETCAQSRNLRIKLFEQFSFFPLLPSTVQYFMSPKRLSEIFWESLDFLNIAEFPWCWENMCWDTREEGSHPTSSSLSPFPNSSYEKDSLENRCIPESSRREERFPPFWVTGSSWAWRRIMKEERR